MTIESDNSLPTEYTGWSGIQKVKSDFIVFLCVSWGNFRQSSRFGISDWLLFL